MLFSCLVPSPKLLLDFAYYCSLCSMNSGLCRSNLKSPGLNIYIKVNLDAYVGLLFTSDGTIFNIHSIDCLYKLLFCVSCKISYEMQF